MTWASRPWPAGTAALSVMLMTTIMGRAAGSGQPITPVA
jgi:hypothetical protein